MSKEDAALSQSLKKLKIESPSANNIASDDDFLDITPMLRKRSKSLSNLEKCSCPKKNFLNIKQQPFKNSTNRKILRDPVLKFIRYATNNSNHLVSSGSNLNSEKDARVFGECSASKEQDFKSIVKACKKISLSNKSDSVGQGYVSKSFRQHRYAKNRGLKSTETPTLNNTCAHQARMNASPPCDITIDELASYFETFVHIPKKMSVMAEMMYI